MRALNYLQEDSAYNHGNIDVVTIATPFLKVDVARLRKDQIFAFHTGGCLITLGISALAIWMSVRWLGDLSGPVNQVAAAAIGIGVTIISGLLIGLLTGVGSDDSKERKTPPANERARLLAKQVRYPAQGAQGRLLVVRGMQDEAAMALMLGSIGVRLTDLSTSVSSKLGLLLFILGVIAPSSFSKTLLLRAGVGFLIFTVAGLALGNLVKAVYGRELLLGSAPIVVSGDSVPDLQGPATVVTLPRRGQRGNSLLHSLYDHPQCASLVARWIRGTAAEGGGPLNRLGDDGPTMSDQ